MHYNDPLLQKFYSRSPLIIQSILVNLYGLLQKKQRYGSYFLKYFNFLLEAQYYDHDRILDYQNSKVKQIVKWAYETVPFYRELFDKINLKPNDIQSVRDIVKIPILEKDIIREKFELFISTKYPVNKAKEFHTSGTTGKPLTILVSKNCFQREYAFRWFHYSLGGIYRGDKIATLAGHLIVPINKTKPPFWQFNYFENQMLFSSYHITSKTIPYYIDALVKFQPKMIHGYPSSIYLIALYLLKNKISELKPKAIYCASETLLSYQREVIEKAFNCKVFNWYGNTEMVSHIFECEHGNLHIHPFHSLTEIIDNNGKRIEPGQEGLIVGTAFDNFSMPLIRYRIRDVIKLSTKSYCPCGRNFPIVESIIGRVEDYVITPEGKLIGRLDHVFKSDVNVVEAQLIQEKIDLLRIKIVKDKNFNIADEKKIIENLRQRVGNKMKFEIEVVDHIPKDANGKFKFVISKVKPEDVYES